MTPGLRTIVCPGDTFRLTWCVLCVARMWLNGWRPGAGYRIMQVFLMDEGTDSW